MLAPGPGGMTFKILACTSPWYCNGPNKAEGLLISLLPRTILLYRLGIKCVLTSTYNWLEEVGNFTHVTSQGLGEGFEPRIFDVLASPEFEP